jgi:hypothetical protein
LRLIDGDAATQGIPGFLLSLLGGEERARWKITGSKNIQPQTLLGLGK